MTFAKIFETELGQILVKKDVDGDGQPEVRFYIELDDRGVCSFALTEKDTGAGREAIEEAFIATDEDRARAVFQIILNGLSETKH